MVLPTPLTPTMSSAPGNAASSAPPRSMSAMICVSSAFTPEVSVILSSLTRFLSASMMLPAAPTPMSQSISVFSNSS